MAKKVARRLEKKANKGNDRAARQYMRARRGIKQSYVDLKRWEIQTRKNVLRNLSACFLYVMHVHYGFGRGRLLKLRDKMQSEFDSITGKKVSVEEIAAFLAEEYELEVGVAVSNTKDRERQIEEQGVRELSAAFLMALLDEFNFKQKRLTDAYWYACELSDYLADGTITYDQIHEKIEVIMNGKRRKRAGAVPVVRGRSNRAVG
jgi:hypothetical protein